MIEAANDNRAETNPEVSKGISIDAEFQVRLQALHGKLVSVHPKDESDFVAAKQLADALRECDGLIAEVQKAFQDQLNIDANAARDKSSVLQTLMTFYRPNIMALIQAIDPELYKKSMVAHVQ